MAGSSPSHVPPRKAAGVPVLIASDGKSLPLDKLALDKGEYTEDWLQRLAHDHPEVLPVDRIEPGFGQIYAVAREVPCAHGSIDNLFITANGDLVLVEAKLWRNPQARREVVAQSLDYVAALSTMSYEAFEAACRKGRGLPALSLVLSVGCELVSPEQTHLKRAVLQAARLCHPASAAERRSR